MPSDGLPASDGAETRSDRVKLVYNAQIDSPTGVVLDYLLNNPHFTSRQGRQNAMDAISAFYRPLAEEAKGELPASELQQVALHCVEVLVKHIDTLCRHFQLEHPLASPTPTVPPATLSHLEAVLADGLQAIAQAIQTGGVFAPPPSVPADHPTIQQITLQSSPPFEPGVIMDGDELGELGLLLADDSSFSEMAA